MAGLSILLCDDEVALAEELAEYLAGAGWRVSLCHAAGEAMMMLLNGLKPDILLTDLRIDDQDGATLVGFAKALPQSQRPRIHAIMTGDVAPAIMAGELGVDALYVKPIDPETLVADFEARLEPRQPKHGEDESRAP